MRRAHFAARFVARLFRASWVTVASTVVALLLVGSVIALVAFQNATIDAQRERLVQRSQEAAKSNARYDRLYGDYSKLYEESTAQGVQPSTAEPTDVPSTASSGSSGATGAAGAAGVDGRDGRDGTDGADGSDGRDGEDGADGADGAPGATGSTGETGAPGQTGAAGSAGATGSQGPPGTPGAAGTDGRGVASLTCNADGSWTVTFTDDTTQTTDGPCRVDPITEPTPAPSEGSQ